MRSNKHNQNESTNRQPSRLLVAVMVLWLAAGAGCSGNEKQSDVVMRAASDVKLHELPEGVDCPPGGHAYKNERNTADGNKKFTHLLLGPVDPRTPNSPMYSLHINQAYNVNGIQDWVVCGTDATSDLGKDTGFRFSGNAVVSKAGSIVLLTLPQAA